MDIKNIAFFDFDKTLVDEPDNYNEEDNYMDSLESLEYNFTLKKEIESDYLKAKKCSETLTVILTNRTIKLRNEVLEILSEIGVDFDATLFRIEDRSKGNRLNCFLNTILEYHTIENIEFWDDKHKHIKDVKRISNHHPNINFTLNLTK